MTDPVARRLPERPAPRGPAGIAEYDACEGVPVVVKEHIHPIVTGLLRRGGRGLLVHRVPTRRWFPNCWDLPGGHVEDGEAPDAALRRELAEELGIAATVAGAPFAHVRGETFRMDVWVIDQWKGEPTNAEPAEHDAIAWMNHQEMRSLTLAHTRLASLFEAALR